MEVDVEGESDNKHNNMETHKHKITGEERQLLIDTINTVVVKGHHKATPLEENETRTPEEWRDSGEDYGRESSMIVVHDGGDHAGYFNLSYCQYDQIDKMHNALKRLGFYAEQCTCWYSAIYRS
jgi:hypothetical protein|tara:strand:- start:1871 stop:2242 length:372 start_codon:yes stop_codon:yes gene_type:complete